MDQEQKSHPVGGVDYPRTLQEFDAWFCTEKACKDYLSRLRWPNCFVCPRCQKKDAWLTSRGNFRCVACHHQTSPIAGTLFDKTHKPLRIWFQAIWYVTSQKFGGSALGLQRVLGFGSYETAWSWLHKMRRAMVRPGREQLSGNVEVDETFVGGESRRGKRGRGAERKAIVVIAIEVHEPKGFGRVRMQRVPDASGRHLSSFVCDAIVPGSVVLTDAWKGYNDISQLGYERKVTVISATGDPAHVSMPGVHRVSALLKRWLLGTHQGAVSEKQLDYYLDEYTFRFNRRTSKARGLLFYRLLQHAVALGPRPYVNIIHRVS